MPGPPSRPPAGGSRGAWPAAGLAVATAAAALALLAPAAGLWSRFDGLAVGATAALLSVLAVGARTVELDELEYTCSEGGGTGLQHRQDEYLRAVEQADIAKHVSYGAFLVLLAFMMGLGKGGVPGVSTSSMALNSMLAPEGCIAFAIALVVPATFMADCAVLAVYRGHARLDVVKRLTVPTVVGVAMGSQLLGKITSTHAKLLIGSALGTILAINVVNHLTGTATKPSQSPGKAGPAAAKPGSPIKAERGRVGDGAAPGGGGVNTRDAPLPYATSWWFATVIGLLGGFATILTNSMGPLLNVYLLAHKFEPKVFVGTRATFFTIINSIKLLAQFQAGLLDLRLLAISLVQGMAAMVGVAASKMVVSRMSKSFFMTLEYSLMTLASVRLIYSGLTAGEP